MRYQSNSHRKQPHLHICALCAISQCICSPKSQIGWRSDQGAMTGVTTYVLVRSLRGNQLPNYCVRLSFQFTLFLGMIHSPLQGRECAVTIQFCMRRANLLSTPILHNRRPGVGSSLMGRKTSFSHRRRIRHLKSFKSSFSASFHTSMTT